MLCEIYIAHLLNGYGSGIFAANPAACSARVCVCVCVCVSVSVCV